MTSGAIEIVERLGEESYAYVRRVDEKRLVVEMRGRVTPGDGETASFSASLSDVHLFDRGGRRV